MKAVVVCSDHQKKFACGIARNMELPLLELSTSLYADSEMQVAPNIEGDLDGVHALVVHATCRPVHDTIMWLIFACRRLKQKGVKKITALIPYFGYARQDLFPDGKPGAVYTVLDMMAVAGIDEIVTVEMHEPHIVERSPIPIHNITLELFFADHIKNMYGSDGTLIAPDHGSQKRVEAVADVLNVPVVTFSKERYALNKTRITSQEGDCTTHSCVIIDDIIDTGSTIIDVASMLKQEHPEVNVSAYAVHSVLSGNAADCLQQSVLDAVWVTDTIDQSRQMFEKLQVVSIVDVVADVLSCRIGVGWAGHK